MDQLETRDLKYFVVLAEELHFGRAAERLLIAQPILSRTIGRLERRLGVILFDRTSRRVTLTTAGEVLLAEARTTLRALERAVQRTQAADSRLLRLAATPGGGSGALRGLLAAHEGQVDMHFVRDPLAAVRAGLADVAIACDSDSLHGLATLPVMAEEPVALIPANHPLAGSSQVTMAQLRRQPTYAESCPPVSLDHIVDLVALDRLIVVVGASAADRIGADVVSVPVVDLPPTTMVLAWPEDSTDREIAALVGTASATHLAHHLDVPDRSTA
ncbi:LysR family transcriptional regulator [Actinoplanes sp. TBRC 11911]|uniref:LysR family transcriptional regulator n=1 Tax=Actinoplanes sp. TBRC 11911 TaxID=2729386 RepID=UPI00145FB9A1|nr:LysR family transcriptional regulator [Actinoplanes sp. TBRC 11911]NMO52915.1 LysR family transcriptional regulator [Actinoplanes sp. TBRC 11911]